MISGLDVLKPNDIGINEANGVVFLANPPCDDVGTFGEMRTTPRLLKPRLLPSPYYDIDYRKTSNISRTSVGNIIVDNSDCSWSTACRRCSNYIFIFNLTPGFNGLYRDNCKTRQETFKFRDSVRLILEVLRYVGFTGTCLP